MVWYLVTLRKGFIMNNGIIKRNGLLGQFSDFELHLMNIILKEYAPFVSKPDILDVFNEYIESVDEPLIHEELHHLKLKLVNNK